MLTAALLVTPVKNGASPALPPPVGGWVRTDLERLTDELQALQAVVSPVPIRSTIYRTLLVTHRRTPDASRRSHDCMAEFQKDTLFDLQPTSAALRAPPTGITCAEVLGSKK
jgi:hypothetical protein